MVTNCLNRYFVKFAYNGANYHGWQTQPNAKSVQEVLDLQLSFLFKQNIETLGAGRTDTGVHASQMYAHFDLTSEINKIEESVFKINKMLPEDIVVYDFLKVKNDAHARFDAISRKYQYHIHQFKDAFSNNQSLYVYGNLNVDLMNEASILIMKHHDFACFSKSHTDVKTTLCNISEAYWEALPNGKLIFTIKANRFLRNMVRAIVGTILEIGKNRLTLQDLTEILESKNRSMAGQSVAGKALFLTEIEYPENLFIASTHE